MRLIQCEPGSREPADRVADHHGRGQVQGLDDFAQHCGEQERVNDRASWVRPAVAWPVDRDRAIALGQRAGHEV